MLKIIISPAKKMNYLYHKELSSDTEYVFLKERTDL